ncbi:MAG: AAA family ATPase [Bacilli bacterium]
MYIESITIKNFKGFTKETVKLNKNTLLIGNNSSGKTTVLQALDVFFNVDDIDSVYIRDSTKKVEIAVLVNFDGKYEYMKKIYSIKYGKLERTEGNIKLLDKYVYIYLPIYDYSIKKFLEDLIVAKSLSYINDDACIKLQDVIAKSFDNVTNSINHKMLSNDSRKYVITNDSDVNVSKAFRVSVNEKGFKLDSRNKNTKNRLLYSILINERYDNVIIGIDQIEDMLYDNIEMSLMPKLENSFMQTIVTTHSKKIVKNNDVYDIIPLYKGAVDKVANLYSTFDGKNDIIYVLVEGKYDLPWIKKVINLIDEETNYIVIPGGGFGNLNLLNKVLSQSGHQCRVIKDGDSNDHKNSLKLECIELYTPVDTLNKLFHLNLDSTPHDKKTFFKVCTHYKRGKDDAVKAILSSRVNSFLTKDNPLIEEIKQLLK